MTVHTFHGDGAFPAHKGMPWLARHMAPADIAQQGWQVLAGDLSFPLAVLRQDALEHNLRWMQDFAQRKGVWLAPHGKTTMSPELFRRQLDAGAWGLTLATPYQACVGVEAGARRIIIANQVVGDADWSLLDGLLTQVPDLKLWFLVDSLDQLHLLEAWAARQANDRCFDVLLEMGISGQRTGCRDFSGALALARAIAGSSHARLGGIECYEGGVARCDSAHDAAAVTDLVRRVQEVARACDAEGLWAEGDAILITAGGSAVFDLVIPLLQTQGLSRPVQGVLRSGCYVTHDHGNYRRFLQLVEQREGLDDSLRPALEVWALVQSVPEPGLALLTCGRRDISHDLEMPMPVGHAPVGAEAVGPVPVHWKITALNDQHAYLRFDADQASAEAPRVGDRVVLGISHPCTTFDKWRWMPVIDEATRVVGAVTTRF